MVDKVHGLVKKHGTNDPFQLARALKILVLFYELGQTYGYYHSYKRVKMIVINCDLDEWLKRYVCAHELGHAVLHPDINTGFLKKHTLFPIGRFEREANEFAINLLLYGEKLEDYETKYDILRANGIPYEMERFLV